MTTLSFESLRSDWYSANTVLPRLVVKAVLRSEPLIFEGFPAVWIPVCLHYGIALSNSRPPLSYIPLFSDISPARILSMATEARNKGAARALAEAAAALDPVIADFVYIVDHKLAAAGFTGAGADGQNLLNTWHSFARPEIVSLQNRMCHERAETDGFLMLPCSRHRPYNESRTHSRLRLQLSDAGQDVRALQSVVVTALGVVPERYWREPLVMSYDAGAVDLWRVFELLRAYFTTNPPRAVVDCLSFRPYSEMLDRLYEMGVIPAPVRPLKVRWRGFHVRLR